MKTIAWAIPAFIAAVVLGGIGLSRLPIERIGAPPPKPPPEVATPQEAPAPVAATSPPAETYSDSASTADAPEGTLRIQGSSRVGCVSESRYERLMTFASQSDNEAFKKELFAGVLDGDCTVFKENEPVYRSDGGSFGRVRLRRPGDTAEYLAPIEAAG
jgi:hypothetical protein